MLKPLMQSILNEALKFPPEKDKEQEKEAAFLGQELLEKLWEPEEKPSTFWGKVKSVLSDEIGLPQKLFDRMVDFRKHHGFADKKEEMQHVMFYATKAFREGTEMIAAGCYLFNHNPKAFEKYATSGVDFAEDIRQSTPDEENTFMPFLCMTIPMATNEHIDDRRLPLLSFAPIKYGIHPCLMDSKVMIEKYKELFSEFSLQGFKTDPYKFVPLKKLLYIEQPESHYPDLRHRAIVIAMNEFNKQLHHEPVKVCTHKGSKTSVDDKQKTR